MLPIALTSLILAALLLAPVQCEATPRVHSLFEPAASVAGTGGPSNGHGGHDGGAAGHAVADRGSEAATARESESDQADPPTRPALDQAPAVVPALGDPTWEPFAGRGGRPFLSRLDRPAGLAIAPEPPPPKRAGAILTWLVA